MSSPMHKNLFAIALGFLLVAATASFADPPPAGPDGGQSGPAEPLLQERPYAPGFNGAEIRWIPMPPATRMLRYGARVACFAIAIDAKGNVSDVRLLASSRSADVDTYMAHSLKKASVNPATLNGKPVAVKFVFVERWSFGGGTGTDEPPPPCPKDKLDDFPSAPSPATTAPPPRN